MLLLLYYYLLLLTQRRGTTLEHKKEEEDEKKKEIGPVLSTCVRDFRLVVVVVLALCEATAGAYVVK